MSLQRRTIVVDHTMNKKYRSMTKSYDDLRIQVLTLRNYQKKFGNRFMIDGHDIELIETTDNGNSQPVRCMETGVIYKSLTEAAEDTGISKSTISMHLRGKCIATKNIHFRKVVER